MTTSLLILCLPNHLNQHIGHFDIGAIVIALPMQPTKNPFRPMPTKVQLDQERKLAEVRECLFSVIQNYVSVEGEEEDDEIGADDGGESSDNTRNASAKHRPGCLGPLNIQGRIDHRLSIADVLSKTNNDDCYRQNWDHISKTLRRIQNYEAMGRMPSSGGGGSDYFLGNQEYGAYNVFSSVPPSLHAAVALNAAMERYTGTCHNSFF
jgi:hypothetical protein